MQRQPFIGGNWKMHDDLQQLTDLLTGITQALEGFSRADVVIFPSFVYLPALWPLLDDSMVALGGQNLCQHSVGAYTGEISASMLYECGCNYVIVGHSERRAIYHERDALIGEKVSMAQQHGLTPIICVGETAVEREAGQTTAVVCRQLDAVLDQADMRSLAEAIVAYEPVWAIGSGQSASGEQIQQVHQTLRAHIAKRDPAIAEQMRIIYGGSVKAATAPQIFALADVDGGLIGGASLQIESFVAICRAVVHNGGQ